MTSTKEGRILQHFEYAVVCTVSSLEDKAFPAEITRQLNITLNRHVSLAQVFIALERMENKGYLSSRESGPEPVKGGRRRRIFKMEESGAQAIRNTAAIFSTSYPSEHVNGDGHVGKQERAKNDCTLQPAQSCSVLT